MTKTQYLPAEWLDEVVPDRVDHPDDLIHLIDGQWILLPTDEDDRDVWRTVVTPGEFVEFCEFRDHGKWTISIESQRDADGAPIWRGGEAIDADANCFYCDDNDDEAFGGTLSELIHTMFANTPDLAGTFTVWAYRWSEGKNWYFAEDDDGVGHFAEPDTFGSEAVR